MTFRRQPPLRASLALAEAIAELPDVLHAPKVPSQVRSGGTIVAVAGERGSGKTTKLTFFAWNAAKGHRHIPSNFDLALPGVEDLPVPRKPAKDEDEEEYESYLRGFFGNLDNSLVLMSEAYRMALDSRRSMDGRALAWSYWFSETRKSGTDVGVDTQSIMKLDVRLRELLDYLVIEGCLVCEGCGASGRWACTCPCALTEDCGAEYSVEQWYKPGVGIKDELEPLSCGPQVWLRTPLYPLFQSYKRLNFTPRKVAPVPSGPIPGLNVPTTTKPPDAAPDVDLDAIMKEAARVAQSPP